MDCFVVVTPQDDGSVFRMTGGERGIIFIKKLLTKVIKKYAMNIIYVYFSVYKRICFIKVY